MASGRPEAGAVAAAAARSGPSSAPVSADPVGALRRVLSGEFAHRVRWGLRERAPKLRPGGRGFDLEAYRALFELRRWRPEDLILDVGANDGRTVRRLRRYLPPTRVIAFEPVAETFERLRENTAGLRDVELRRLALGAAEEERDIFIGPLAALNSLHRGFQATERVERVPVTTLDAFLAREGVRQAQLLKIDAEGHDLEVLRGAEEALREGRIEIVQVEAGFGAPGVRQPSLEDIRAHLIERGYHLWAILNQCRGPALAERRGRPSPPILTYCDAIFVHERAETRIQLSPADRLLGGDEP